MDGHRLLCSKGGLTDDAREVQALEQDAKLPPTVRIEGLLDSRKADGPVDTHPQAVGKATTTAAAAGLQFEVSFMATPWLVLLRAGLSGALAWIPSHPLCIFVGNASEYHVKPCAKTFSTILSHDPRSYFDALTYSGSTTHHIHGRKR